MVRDKRALGTDGTMSSLEVGAGAKESVGWRNKGRMVREKKEMATDDTMSSSEVGGKESVRWRKKGRMVREEMGKGKVVGEW